MTADEEAVPWPTSLALVTGVLGALPLLFVTAVVWAYAGEIPGGPVLAATLLVLVAGQVTGLVLLRNRRSWRVLVGVSLAVVVAVPVAALATSGSSSEPVAETVLGLVVLSAGPALTAVLASRPGARRWGSPSRSPANAQPVPRQGS